jgi:hypothetical protein
VAKGLCIRPSRPSRRSPTAHEPVGFFSFDVNPLSTNEIPNKHRSHLFSQALYLNDNRAQSACNISIAAGMGAEDNSGLLFQANACRV